MERSLADHASLATPAPRESLSETESAVIAALDEIAIEFLPYVPCSTAAGILRHLARRASPRAFVITKEEEGVGIVSGLVMAGRRAALLMQDTGFGNAITA